MALIGSINNQGSLQGEMNNANGYLTGIIKTGGQLGGQIVAERGLKGEKGDTGDTGATGNGIDNIAKTSTAGLVDTYTVTYTNTNTDTFTVTNGADGADGADGYSPSASVSKVGDTATITITDENGTTTASVTDGTDGTDGYSPSASVSKVGDTATITITDENGTTTASISDGTDGQNGHSPIVTASKVDKTTTVYVDGSAIATIDDGEDGQDGTDGQDGYSPSASVSKVGDTATITITDKGGTTTASVNDGVGVPSGGTAGQVLTKDSNTDYDVEWADPSAGAYIVTFTYDDANDEWSCDKTAQEIYEAHKSGMSVIGVWSDYHEGTDEGVSYEDDAAAFLLLDHANRYSENGVSNYVADFYEPYISFEDPFMGIWRIYVDDDTVSSNSGYFYCVPTTRKINNKALSADITLKTSDLTNDSGFITGMTILSYGSSTWNDFITAYNANKVVYCRASSNANPATGAQTRLAFMAYVNNATPTEVEFQYYRSVSSHSDSQQGDQVFVYKLNSSGTWSVTTREAYSKVVAGTNMSSSYSSGKITLSATDTTYSDFTGTDGNSDGTHGLVPAPQTTDANKYLKADGTWATVSGGSSNLYVATYGTTTSAEIETAYQANKCVCVFRNGYIYHLQYRYSATKHTFSCLVGSTRYQVVCNNGSWTNTSTTFATGTIPTNTSDLYNDSGFISSIGSLYREGSVYLTTDLTFNPNTDPDFGGFRWVNAYIDIGLRTFVVAWECVEGLGVEVTTLEFQDSNYNTYTLYFPFEEYDTWGNYINSPYNMLSDGRLVFEIDYNGYIVFNLPHFSGGGQEEVYLYGSRVSHYDTIEIGGQYQSEWISE